jgi:hypothetical protein
LHSPWTSASRALYATRLISFRIVRKQLDQEFLMITNCLLAFQHDWTARDSFSQQESMPSD